MGAVTSIADAIRSRALQLGIIGAPTNAVNAKLLALCAACCLLAGGT